MRKLSQFSSSDVDDHQPNVSRETSSQAEIATPLIDDDSPDNSPNQSPFDEAPSVSRPPIIFATDKWTWNKSDLPSKITRLQINKGIIAWMDYYPAFQNWVKACIAFHVDNCRGIESVCRIPDQFRDEIGESITIVTANMIPAPRKGDTHIFQEGVYHVMMMA